MDNKNYHEINTYKDKLFPVEIYNVTENGMTPLGRGIKDFHWHEEIQITLAVKGSLVLQADSKQYFLNEGEAAFINSGIIHAVISISKGGKYSSLNFQYKILSFFQGSRMEKEYVLPYITENCTPVMILKNKSSRQKQALDILYEINNIWNKNMVNKNEYLISLKIVNLWYILISDIEIYNKDKGSLNLIRRQRLQSMLTFIYENFYEDILLSDIANSAHISVGECCRIFKQHLQTTPYQFLTEYRIRKSIELLSGELSVSQISIRCGYNQVSNYIAKFKSIMKCTPAQYRKNNKDKSGV